MIIWGNHSATQYPDISHTLVGDKAAVNLVDQAWVEKDFIPVVQQRGAATIRARGLSSAATAAAAAVNPMHYLARGTNRTWVSKGNTSAGSYGINPGIDNGYPEIGTATGQTTIQNTQL